jgi:hypothetical protein
MLTEIGKLSDGDCFFYMSPSEYRAREKYLDDVNEFRRSIGDAPFTGNYLANLIRCTASSFQVYAVVRSTGERCTLRLPDMKREIWYDAKTLVQYTPDRAAFEQRLDEIRKGRKKLEEEQARMQRARSKKHNAGHEIEERTLIAGR